MGAADKDDDETEEVFQRRKTYSPLCADLIDAYEKDPAKIRSQMRELQERDTLVASLAAKKDTFPSMILSPSPLIFTVHSLTPFSVLFSFFSFFSFSFPKQSNNW